MSRCFPFPPPGYEKKARTDAVDLLKKEKQKEKKAKREKKEKDRSDGKHKDRKDKKEKHKDKKEKDRDKEKDRSNNSEEKKFLGHMGQNGEKTTEEKKLPGKSEGHSGEKFIQKERGRDKDQRSFSGESVSGYNGEKISQNSHLAEDFRDSKFVQELERRVRDEVVEAENQFVDKFMATNHKRDEGMVRLVAKATNGLAEEKEKNNKIDDKKLDVQGIMEETRSSGNAMVENLTEAVKARVEGISGQVEGNIERGSEEKERTKGKERDNKIRDKRKDKNREKKSHGKDKDRDKEKKKEEEKAKGEHRNLKQDNLRGSINDDLMGTIDLKNAHLDNKGAEDEENQRKRKDLETNGFGHVVDIRPHKVPRTSSPQPLMHNRNTLESCKAPIPFSSDRLGAGTYHSVDNREGKVNGITEAQLLSVSQTTARAQASQMDEVSIRPPHPDTKYLSQVLSVPEMEEWSDFDEQSWLFDSDESQSKKPNMGFSNIDEGPQVWAKALQIESVDICALPYVIPY